MYMDVYIIRDWYDTDQTLMKTIISCIHQVTVNAKGKAVVTLIVFLFSEKKHTNKIVNHGT